jgi:hypothetical protein
MAKRRAKVKKSPRPANNLRVSLDMDTDPWTVVVDQSKDENVLQRSTNIQVIKWYLVGNAAAGRFVRHQWMAQNRPRATFGPFLIDEGGKRATMCDLYDQDTKQGQWAYSLTIELAGNTYSSPVKPAAGGGNPNITNN